LIFGIASPIRSCVGCGARRVQAELVRLFFTPEGVLDADPDRRHGGRGAYVCARAECLWEAVRRSRFSRALRRPAGSLDEATVGARVADRVREQMLRRLHTARRAGAALPGPSEEIPAAQVRLVALADGAPEPPYGAPVVRVGPREALALALQAPWASFAAVLAEPVADGLLRLASVRAEFLRTPPPRRPGRPPRPGPAVPPAGAGERMSAPAHDTF
jgi:hypothetical protein